MEFSVGKEQLGYVVVSLKIIFTRRTCNFRASLSDAFSPESRTNIAFYLYCSMVAPVFLYLSFGPPMFCSSLLRARQPCWKLLCLHSHFLSPSLQPHCRASDFPISGLFHLLNIPELCWGSNPHVLSAATTVHSSPALFPGLCMERTTWKAH